MNSSKVLESLNKILEHELAGVVKYTHYAFMVQGPYRLSVVQWLREQALESLTHAEAVGEHITSLGEHPTLKISDLLETHKHSTEDILNKVLDGQIPGMLLKRHSATFTVIEWGTLLTKNSYSHFIKHT